MHLMSILANAISGSALLLISKDNVSQVANVTDIERERLVELSTAVKFAFKSILSR
jgi:hypothetical protein